MKWRTGGEVTVRVCVLTTGTERWEDGGPLWVVVPHPATASVATMTTARLSELRW